MSEAIVGTLALKGQKFWMWMCVTRNEALKADVGWYSAQVVGPRVILMLFGDRLQPSCPRQMLVTVDAR
jgi:hypothetical protein